MKYKPMPMKRGEYESLVKLLEYSRADELRHYNDTTHHEGHIYNDIVTLDGYIDKCKHKEVRDEGV